jgi:hypothetical protein
MASRSRLGIFPVLVATEMLCFASLAFIIAIRGLKIADMKFAWWKVLIALLVPCISIYWMVAGYDLR